MKNIFRRRRTWLIIVVLLIAAPVVYFYAMMSSFTWNDKEISEFFETKSMHPQFNYYKIQDRSVYYATAGNDTLPMVLFIHGAPGSWYDYIKYFADSNLVSRAYLVALDRPGYGKSGEGKYVTSIDEQVKLIEPLLALNKSKQPVTLVAHSYGGPIAVKLAIENPEKIRAMLLLAPQLDPANEKQFTINTIASLKPVQWIIPKMWLSAYYEKKTHVDELKKLDGEWDKLSTPIFYMYGEKDQLVPPANAGYAERKVKHAKLQMITFPNENHFIPWTQQDSVTKIILKMIGD